MLVSMRNEQKYAVKRVEMSTYEFLNQSLEYVYQPCNTHTNAFISDNVVLQDPVSIVKTSDHQHKEETKQFARNVVDTSMFTIEQRLLTAVWVHERKQLHMNLAQIKRKFRERFGRSPPTKNTLLAWERKLFSTGSVHDAPRSGRPSTRQKHVTAVSESLTAAPGLSQRARASALRLPRTTLRAILHSQLSKSHKSLNRCPKQHSSCSQSNVSTCNKKIKRKTKSDGVI